MNLPILVLLFSVIIGFGATVLSTELVMTTATHRMLSSEVATQAEDTAQLSMISRIRDIVRQDVLNKLDPYADVQVLDGSSSDAIRAGTTTYYAQWHYSTNNDGAAACSHSSAGAVNDSASQVQCSSFVAEERFSGSLRVALVDSTKHAKLATRTRFLTFRILRAAPYVLVDGVRENETLLSSSASQDSGGEGDGGGVPASSGGTDTTLQAYSGCSRSPKVVNLNEGTSFYGNGDGISQPCDYTVNGQTYNSASGTVGSLSDKAWSNGNNNSSGWTP